ncbi:MAG: tetratricopeptide repeat protein [Blastocatellia bacterium]
MLRVVEDELIDDAAARELSAEEQAHFDSHFLAAPDRRTRLELSLALHDHARQADSCIAKIIRFLRRPSPRVYLSFATAAVLLIILWLIIPSPGTDVSKGLQALNQAYREQRPTEARITGFDYAPLPPSTRGSEQERVDPVARERAEQILQGAVTNHPDAQAYHALGRLYLAEHKFAEAIELFDEASRLNANNAQLESDIGAAYLEKGQVGPPAERNEAYRQSLTHLTRALELNGSLLEARFNRALLYTYTSRKAEARNDWSTYLELDKNQRSPWAEEASRRLKALEKSSRE